MEWTQFTRPQTEEWGKQNGSQSVSSLQNKRRTSNHGLEMSELTWEKELREYKSSHVNKGLNIFISVKLLMLVISVSHRP